MWRQKAWLHPAILLRWSAQSRPFKSPSRAARQGHCTTRSGSGQRAALAPGTAVGVQGRSLQFVMQRQPVRLARVGVTAQSPKDQRGVQQAPGVALRCTAHMWATRAMCPARTDPHPVAAAPGTTPCVSHTTSRPQWPPPSPHTQIGLLVGWSAGPAILWASFAAFTLRVAQGPQASYRALRGAHARGRLPSIRGENSNPFGSPKRY